MLDFCIIGSGVSGSTIAHILSKKYNVEIFDKARGLGGRASNKRFIKNKVLIMEFNIYLQGQKVLKSLFNFFIKKKN